MAAKRRWIGYIIVIIALVGAVYVWKTHGKSDEKPIIRTAKVVRGTVTSSVSANGVLQPLTTVELKSNVGGQVVELAVDEGDFVKAGQLIAKIDPTDSATALEQSQADLAAAESKVNQAKTQLNIQNQQNTAQVESARQALAAARTRLQQAEEQAKVQPSLTSASINQARSSLVAAQATLQQTKTAIIPQMLTSAQAAYNQAKVSFSTAEKDLARQKELLANGFVSRSVVDTAEDRYASAKSQLDNAESKLKTAKDETDQDLFSAQARVDQAQAAYDSALANRIQDKVKQQDVASARASVKQAQAALEVAIANIKQDQLRRGDIIQANAQVTRSKAAVTNATIQMGYTTVVAPRDGIVTKKYVEEGSIVTAGRSSMSGTGAGVALVDIADISRMLCLVNVDETDIAHIEVGQKVDIVVEAYPDELFEGEVTKIAPQSVTDQSVTTIPVTVEVDMPDQRLKPGMNVACDFITGRQVDVLTVPNEAIKESEEATTVTVMENGKQVERTVVTGLMGEDATEIKSGLKEGETIVTAIIHLTNVERNNDGARPGGLGGPGGGIGGGRSRR